MKNIRWNRVWAGTASYATAMRTLSSALSQSQEHLLWSLILVVAAAFWVWFGCKVIRDGVE